VFLLLEAHRLLPAMFAYPGRVWRHPNRGDGFAGGLEACEATLLFNGFAAWQFLGANVFGAIVPDLPCDLHSAGFEVGNKSGAHSRAGRLVAHLVG